MYVKQEGNYVTGITVSTNPTVSVAQLPASGGTKTDTGANGAVTYHFTSTSSATTAPATTYGALTTTKNYTIVSGNGFYVKDAANGVISADTKGTTTSNVTTSNTITKTVTYT